MMDKIRGVFIRGKGDKDDDKSDQSKKQDGDCEETVDKEEIVKEQPDDEGWIWVEGYKGTDENMVCRDYQYILGEKHVHKYDGDVSLCSQGFHFCDILEDVFRYYEIDFKNRYFKVLGLVNKTSYRNMMRERDMPEIWPPTMLPRHPRVDSKIVAKEIIFLEELGYREIEDHVVDRFPFVESESEYNNMGCYYDFSKDKFLNTMRDLGFSEAYSAFKLREFETRVLDCNKKLHMWLEMAKVYSGEGLSRDVLIYLLEN